MKKSISFILAVGMLISAVSCSSEPKKETPAATVQTDELSEAVYKKSAVEVPKEIDYIFGVSPYNEGEKYFLTGAENRFYQANEDFTEIVGDEYSDKRER